MKSLSSFLKGDPLPWLMEEENPSVRYFALVDIVGRPEQDQVVREAKKAIFQKGPVSKILAKQKEGGHWEKREDFYIRTKYRGTVWQVIILAELGADRTDARIEKACEFILSVSQDRESGAFSYQGREKSGGFHSCTLPCLTGNMVWSLIRMGYLDDPRIWRGVEWMTDFRRFDDGVSIPPRGWPYEKKESCWGRHTCLQGVVKSLRALTEIPRERRSPEIERAIQEGAEFLLIHHVFKRSHDLSRAVRPKWWKFGFPTVWDTDALEVLGLLVRLGYKDPRMKEAVDLVLAKQDEQGRWILENTYNGRFQVNIERQGKPSKWVTLKAISALERYCAV